MTQVCHVIEAEGVDVDTGERRLFYWSTHAFVTGPRDLPADQVFDGRIDQLPVIEAHMFGQGRIRGSSQGAFGQASLVNVDGGLDFLRTVNFQGFALTIRRGQVDDLNNPIGAYPVDWQIVVSGTIARSQLTTELLTLTLRDKQAFVASLPIWQSRFKGDNALPNGLEGVADLKDQPQPKPWGEVKNAPVVMVNTQKLIGFLGASGSLYPLTVNAVNDKGAVLTPDATPTYASIAALLDDAQAPAANRYKIFRGDTNTPAYVRFGTAPSGQVTADLLEGNAASDRTVGQLVRRIITGPGGLTDADLDLPSIAALDGAASYSVGWWAQEETIGSALDAICASVGAYWIATPEGLIRLGRPDEPLGASEATFTLDDLTADSGEQLAFIQPADEEAGTPPTVIEILYDHNWTVQNADSLAGVALANKAYLTQEYRSTATPFDATIKARYPLANQIQIQTQLRTLADAQAEAARWKTLIGVRREFARIRVDAAPATGLWLGSIITLQLNRMGLNDGGKFRVIGLARDLAADAVTLFLWR